MRTLPVDKEPTWETPFDPDLVRQVTKRLSVDGLIRREFRLQGLVAAEPGTPLDILLLTYQRISREPVLRHLYGLLLGVAKVKEGQYSLECQQEGMHLIFRQKIDSDVDPNEFWKGHPGPVEDVLVTQPLKIINAETNRGIYHHLQLEQRLRDYEPEWLRRKG